MGKAKKLKRNNSNFRHTKDKSYSKADMQAHFGKGWTPLLDKAFEMVSFIEGAEIKGARRHFGLLHLYVTGSTEDRAMAAEGVAWKVERLSAKICEGCGGYGYRRTTLRYPFNFCTDCFTEYLSKQDDPLSLFREGESGLFNED